jgi:hypothetical protein
MFYLFSKGTPKSPALTNFMKTSTTIASSLIALCLVAALITTSFGIALAPPAYAQESPKPKKQQIIDRKHFFQKFRSQFYAIKEKEAYLVDRYERVLDYWDSQPHLTDLRWLAYILATTYHETGRRIQAVRECFGKTDQASIDCVTGLYRRGRIKRNYAKIDPKTGKAYFGRGHVQLTWDYNYKRMGKELGMNDKVYVNPDLALHPDTSVAIMAEGMIKGLFTGKKLSQYFNSKSTNWGGARRIVNGLDKYQQIGGYARKFYATLKTKPAGLPDPDKDDCTGTSIPQSCLTTLNSEIAILRTNYTDLNNNYQNTLRDNKGLTDRVNALDAELADAKKDLPAVTAELSSLKTAFEKLETRLQTAEEDARAKTAEATRLQALNSELQQKLDDAITTGATGTDGGLLKRRLEELDAKGKALDQKLAAVDLEQTRLTELASTLAAQNVKISAQLKDIEISRDALQARETNLLDDRQRLSRRESSLDEKEVSLESEEQRLQRFEKNLRDEKAAFDEYKSKNWMSNMWDKVSSTWRKE